MKFFIFSFRFFDYCTKQIVTSNFFLKILLIESFPLFSIGIMRIAPLSTHPHATRTMEENKFSVHEILAESVIQIMLVLGNSHIISCKLIYNCA